MSEEELKEYTKGKVHISEVHKTIEKHKEFLQSKVDEFLKNKDNSLEDRWEVWTKYSQKINHRWVYTFSQKTDETLPDCLVNYQDDLEVSRGKVINYDWLLDFACDLEDESQDELVKEWLISKNFGGFTFDW